MTDDELLLPRFVGTYEKLDDPTVWETDPISQQLAVGAPDGYGFDKWRPFQVNAAASLLEPLYAKLPARFPKLFELLILSYRWAEVDLMTDYRHTHRDQTLLDYWNRCQRTPLFGELHCPPDTSNLGRS